MSKHLARVDILGSSFTIKSDEAPDHVAELIEYFERCVADVRKAMPRADALRVAIVTGLNMTDQLFKARSEGESSGSDSRAAAEIATRLIEAIDESLSRVPVDTA